MSDRRTPGPDMHAPPQVPPIDRTVSPGTLHGNRGVEADLFGAPVGDWLEEPGKYLWGYAKDWLNK